MKRIADRIMKRVSARGYGTWVCTPKDFLDLGSRGAVDQALSRLVKAGRLRRAAHGLYDLPRFSEVLKRPAPVDLDAAIKALSRRDNVRIMPDGLAAANRLGLVNAVPARVSFVTDGSTRTHGTVPPRRSARHAMGGKTGGAGGPGAVLAWSRRGGRPGRFHAEKSPPERREARSVAKQPGSARLGASACAQHRG